MMCNCNEGMKGGGVGTTPKFKAGEPRIQHKLVDLRKRGIPVGTDVDREIGADIETAEENGVIRTGISEIRWSQGDALEASGNGRTLN